MADPLESRKTGIRGRQALFLDRLSEGAVVSAAANAAGISPSSAYRMRARCPYFAAGWEAAISLARAPLADSLYERAVMGVTATYRRDGPEVYRHAHDNRLAMSVLARLDKRDQHSRLTNLPWVNVMRYWNEYLDALAHVEFTRIDAILKDELGPGEPRLVDPVDIATPPALLRHPEKVAALCPNSPTPKGKNPISLDWDGEQEEDELSADDAQLLAALERARTCEDGEDLKGIDED